VLAKSRGRSMLGNQSFKRIEYVHGEKSPNDPSSATRPTRACDCNRDAMAGFAAAHGCWNIHEASVLPASPLDKTRLATRWPISQ
jgi:hypothetical protein